MRGLTKLTAIQAKLFLREPPAFFFTLALPVMLLLLFGAIFGAESFPGSSFRGIDAMVPGFFALIIATVALIGIPIATSTARETGVLRRYRATPLRPAVYLTADIAVNFAMTALGMVLMTAVGEVVFGLRLGGSWASVMAGAALGGLAFFACGYLVAGLSPTARVAESVGMVIFFPNLFLSGATIPLEQMPEGVQELTRLIPLRYVVDLLQGLWFGEAWAAQAANLAVVTGLLVVGALVSARTFRWE